MTAWNIVLQQQGLNSGVFPYPQCQRFSIPGISRPCRILFYACDNVAMTLATAAHNDVETTFKARHGATSNHCSGPCPDMRDCMTWDCMTWDEPSCLQVLVPVIGGPISKTVETDILRWQSQAGSLSVILPALLPGINHKTAFQGCSNEISRLNSACWYGNPSRLAAIVTQRALQHEKPGIFISYCRSEAGALVDQLYDGLAHRGFRVFLDRFSGSPGRYFPSELAEEMANKAVLLVIETPKILQSKWTLWEIGFAHRYRLGLVSLQLPSAPSLTRISTRLSVSPIPLTGILSTKDLDSALAFIEKEQVVASLRRRAFYEGLVAGAASFAGGTLYDLGGGLLELRNRSGNAAAVVLPSGKPGQLGDVHSLSTAPLGALPRLLLGQHQHLAPPARSDLNWLAREVSIELHGRYSGYRRLQALC